MPMVVILLRPYGIAVRRTAGEVEMGDVRATEHLHHRDPLVPLTRLRLREDGTGFAVTHWAGPPCPRRVIGTLRLSSPGRPCTSSTKPVTLVRRRSCPA